MKGIQMIISAEITILAVSVIVLGNLIYKFHHRLTRIEIITQILANDLYLRNAARIDELMADIQQNKGGIEEAIQEILKRGIDGLGQD